MRLGPFSIDDQLDIPNAQDLVSKGPCRLDNNAIYIGQWNQSTGHREGKGTQVWQDGSKFVGVWQKDKVNGQGRLIHQDGDVYYGEWLNDCAHGYGTFERVNGPKYEGFWVQDK